MTNMTVEFINSDNKKDKFTINETIVDRSMVSLPFGFQVSKPALALRKTKEDKGFTINRRDQTAVNYRNNRIYGLVCKVERCIKKIQHHQEKRDLRMKSIEEQRDSFLKTLDKTEGASLQEKTTTKSTSRTAAAA